MTPMNKAKARGVLEVGSGAVEKNIELPIGRRLKKRKGELESGECQQPLKAIHRETGHKCLGEAVADEGSLR